MLDGCPIEVKSATSNTLNQVRAVKYIPLVAYHVPTEAWFVVPAPDVVRLVSSKARGQHTENSLRVGDAQRAEPRSVPGHERGRPSRRSP